MTYLRNYEPQELVHVSGNTYCTREHDSLRISNGKWYWFSQDIGGRSALDYLIKVKGLSFMEAVEAIIGQAAERPPVFYRQKEKAHHDFLMPKLSDTTYQVERYLRNRGIHPVIIRYCIEHKTLFESADYHNAVFVGYDKDGTARYGALRGTVGQYKGELTGSDKHFSFSIGENTGAKEIHVFESAIDAMSYATLELLKGHDWKAEIYLFRRTKNVSENTRKNCADLRRLPPRSRKRQEIPQRRISRHKERTPVLSVIRRSKLRSVPNTPSNSLPVLRVKRL